MNLTKRILITGGAGFIGGHIAELLLTQGHQVIAIDNLATGKQQNVPDGAQLVIGDVSDSVVLESIFETGIDAVMHIAGQASISLSFANPAADLNTNTLGTIRVLQACLKHKVPRLLFASSMTIYGANPVTPTPETEPANPISYYAITKYAAERYVHATALRPDLDFNFNVTSFRMFNVYGPRQSLTNSYQGVFAIFVGNVLRGEPIRIYSDGEQARDFVHVTDVARAWVTALDNPASYGQVINLGTGQPTSVNELADLVLAAFGHTRDTYPVEYRTAQAGDMRVSAADIHLAQSLLGWSPQVAVNDGMAETIAWARQISQSIK
ncbi:MAG: NAD-dependent epimerase/dehydratase family protein [Chloroflexota bacterium]